MANFQNFASFINASNIKGYFVVNRGPLVGESLTVLAMLGKIGL
jgi:hypothetical protein